MKNYFEILHLQNNASSADIKSAYRQLVKKFHPDLNPADGARQQFMEIHEAYEFLSNDDRREQYRLNYYRRLTQEELQRRERVYKSWVDNYQQPAQQRASNYAASPYADFKKSRIYRTAMAVNRWYNYLFLFMSLLMIAVPIFKMLMEPTATDEQQNPTWHLLFPMGIGIIFVFAGYYFLFVQKVDND